MLGQEGLMQSLDKCREKELIEGKKWFCFCNGPSYGNVGFLLTYMKRLKMWRDARDAKMS